MGAYRGHQWTVKDAYGQLVLNHTTQGELQHVKIPDSPAVSGEKTELTFENKFGAEVEIYWLEASFYEEIYQGSLLPKQSVSKETFSGHLWIIRQAETKEEVVTCFGASKR